jgi:hypothetical protein
MNRFYPCRPLTRRIIGTATIDGVKRTPIVYECVTYECTDAGRNRFRRVHRVRTADGKTHFVKRVNVRTRDGRQPQPHGTNL